VCTVHHIELIFVMPKNLSVPLKDIFAERANTYLLMYAHWSKKKKKKDGSVHHTDSNSLATNYGIQEIKPALSDVIPRRILIRR